MKYIKIYNWINLVWFTFEFLSDSLPKQRILSNYLYLYDFFEYYPQKHVVFYVDNLSVLLDQRFFVWEANIPIDLHINVMDVLVKTKIRLNNKSKLNKTKYLRVVQFQDHALSLPLTAAQQWFESQRVLYFSPKVHIWIKSNHNKYFH